MSWLLLPSGFCLLLGTATGEIVFSESRSVMCRGKRAGVEKSATRVGDNARCIEAAVRSFSPSVASGLEKSATDRYACGQERLGRGEYSGRGG